MQARYEVLEKSFMSETELAIQAYTKDAETLKWALENKRITEEQYRQQSQELRVNTWGTELEQQQLQYEMEQQALQIALENKYITEQQYQQKIMALRSQEMQTTLGHYNSLFGNMANIAKAGGDRATGIVKAFSIAQGLINSYLAYTQVLADPTLVGRPFLRQVLAASTLAAGLAQVANMRSSSGGGGSSAPTSASGTSAPQEPERLVRVSLDGPDWVKGIVEPIMTQIYEQTGDGTRVIFER
jgi:hypothetical protein